MKRSILILIAWVLLCSSQISAEEARLLRFPDVHTDRVTFSYAGDIYVAPRSGGQAIRLTSHEGLELFPKFSPDGSKIAFTGQYDGDMAVYVTAATGGEPKRLTYHPAIQRTSERFGPENIVMDWHPDGDRVLYRSRKEVNDWWDGRVYLVSLKGGLPEPLPMAVAGFTSFSPDAKKVAYCPIYRDFRTWKRYKGGMAQDVWIFDLDSLQSEKITDWKGTDNMPMWYGDKIYFSSDRTGTLNLYSYSTVTGETRQVTQFTEYDVRWPSLGPAGIAFENAGYLYVLDLPSETQRRVNIEITADQPWMRPQYVDVSDDIRDFDLSPDGSRAAFEARGDIFTVPKKEGNTRNLTRSSGVHNREPRWSPDGKWIACLSDETGEEELYLLSNDGKEKIQVTTDGSCRRYAPEWSPDSRKLVFSDKNLVLYYVDVETKELVQIDKAERSEIRQYSWSPDSKYIAYHKRGKNRISTIYVFSLDENVVHQVTRGFTNDYSPVFDPGGKYLYFLSQRDFNPILGSYEFQFINESITNLFLLLLSADGESPFAPKSDEVAVDDNGRDNAKGEGNEKKTEKDAPIEVKIDFEGIDEREVAFDIPAGSYRGLAAINGAVFYSSSPIWGMRGKIGEDATVLHKYDIEAEEDHRFAEDIMAYAIGHGGKKMLLRTSAGFHLMETSGDKANLEGNSLQVANLEVLLDRRVEYRQIFDEVWRMQRDFFYDREMHGVDWAIMGERYRALLPHVSNRFDLTYVIGEMIGELCCSHTYVGGGDRPRTESSGVGLLGVDFDIDKANNRIVIARILRGENWNEEIRSPLLDPGIDVREGDYLLAVDGQELFADVNPYSLTVNTVGRTVTLTVNDKPDMHGAREASVRPLASEEYLRYYNWVEDRRQYVDSVSDGQIGYIHLPDMDTHGLVKFAEMFYHQIRRPGLIIDVRYNGGGFVSGLILERLRRVVKAMGMSRNGGVGPMPGSGLNAHMITLLNEFSCSDGDYFPYFFREYDLGPLMGKRSWGGVIGIRGGAPLVDGGYCTVPESGIYSLDGEWIMENVGVQPDIEIDNLPERVAQGYDDQLDAAIEYVSKKIEEDPRSLPPLPPPPEKR